MPLDQEIVDARIRLRVAELRVIAASMFVQLLRHGSGGALPHADRGVIPSPRPASSTVSGSVARVLSR
jgi:hypothetical protein